MPQNGAYLFVFCHLPAPERGGQFLCFFCGAFSAPLCGVRTEALRSVLGSPVRSSHRGFAERCGVCTGEPRFALRRWVRVLQRGAGSARRLAWRRKRLRAALGRGCIEKRHIFEKKTKPFSELLLRKGLNRITDYQYLSTTSKSQMSR